MISVSIASTIRQASGNPPLLPQADNSCRDERFPVGLVERHSSAQFLQQIKGDSEADALVNRVNRRMCIRMVRFWRST
jgi:hypothetical protein